IHGKSYIIPTFSKTPVEKDLHQEKQDLSSQIQIISAIKNLENRATIKKEFIRALDYAEYLKKELIRFQDSA
ncbi:21380_t:CDS:2, partial [Gigaspora margarita]